jgi:hypothetical protein
MEEDYGVPNVLAMDTGAPLMTRRFQRPWLNRPRFDAPGQRSPLQEDALAAVHGAGGKPENPAPVLPPPSSTGTKYQTDWLGVSGMGSEIGKGLSGLASWVGNLGEGGEAPQGQQNKSDAERRADHARINAAMPKSVPPLAKEVPGTLHYSVGGGPLRSRAPGQSGPAGEDFSASQGAGFGQAWTPARGGHGGYMQSDINSLPWEQKPESYKSSHLSPAQEMMSPIGVERERSRLQYDVEQKRRGENLSAVNEARGMAAKDMQNAQALPEPHRTAEITKITNNLTDAIKTINESFGIGARLTSNALYGP